MKKEYVTARLFKNRSAADGMITNEQSHDSDQQQTAETQNNSQENSETSDSNENQNESFLPQRVQRVIQRALENLGLDRND
jgi:hypothetical protein